MIGFRRIGFYVLSLWLLALPAKAQDTGVFYALEKDGQIRGYLLGTMHSDDPRVNDLPDAVMDAFDRSSVLAVELVMNSLAQFSAAQNMMLLDGSTLPDVTGRELFDRVVATMQAKGVPSHTAKALKPWAAAVVVGTPIQNPAKVLDMVLQEKAVAAGKTLRGLETVSEQTSAFDAFSMDEQVAFLKSTLDNLDRVPEVMEEMITAYAAGDLQRLVSITQREKDVMGEQLATRFFDELVVKRNYRLFDRVMEIMGDKAVFIAVGAMHLPGETGMISQFRQAGYTVRLVR